MAVFGMITDEYNTWWYISRAVKEMTMVSNNGASSIGALWYLSALIIVMPLFCCLCQINARHLAYIVACFYVVIYVNTFRIEGYVDYPINLFRVINGLCIGMLIYFVKSIIYERYVSVAGINKVTKVFLTFIEQGILLFVLFETWNNENNIEFVFICMVAGLIIMLSEITYSALLKSCICDYLGRLIYLVLCIVNAMIIETVIFRIKNAKS